MPDRIFLSENVLDAARRRISFIFDEFDDVNVSISGGKDSTVLAHLALEEAKKRARKVGFFFLDEEVVYQATIDQVSYLMELAPSNINRYWLQIPFHLTNTTSIDEPFVRCWDVADKKKWMRKRSAKNILSQPWTHESVVTDKKKGLDFYDVLTNWEMMHSSSASLVGLRADESLNRWRTMTKHKGYKGLYWSTSSNKTSTHFYPIYDWRTDDIWHYIYDNNIRYHAYYDFAWRRGTPISGMRVSSLVHEHAFKSIVELPEFEPETYQKLCERIKGISFAQETARERKMFRCSKLPDEYKSWKDYRDFLLKNYRNPEYIPLFEKRFSKQLNNEYVWRQQCRQLVCGDYENNLVVDNRPDPRIELVRVWSDEL